MGIFGAMNTAVSGLRAQSYALENISGNIANSQTTGFKRLDTSFADLVSGGAASLARQTSGIVLSAARNTNGAQGDITGSSTPTHMAINGDGYFVIRQQTGEVDGRPVFAAQDLYTRRGDFDTDADGYLVNGAGYFLMGLKLDPVTGNAVGSVPEVIQLSSDFLKAERTTNIEYRANLADLPRVSSYDPDIPGSELLDPSLYANDPTAAGDGTVLGEDVETFLDNSVSGGAITVYDANGTPLSMQFRWAKIDSKETGGTDTWNLFYLSDSEAGTGQPAWQNVGEDYAFDDAGVLTTAIPNVTLTALTLNGTAVGDVELKHGSNGITQYADPNGTARVTALGQNGSPSGEMLDIQISDDGKVIANYSNGKTIAIASIPVVSFNADSGLRRLDGGAFAATPQAGPPIMGAAGTIVAQSLEASNTDIADEFSKLIVTQQAYNANTRIISTADEMVKEVLNVIR